MKFSNIEIIMSLSNQKNRSSLHARYYAVACNEWGSTSTTRRLDNTAPKKHGSGGDTAFDLTARESKSKILRSDIDALRVPADQR